MSEGWSNVATPPPTPTVPQNPLPITFSGFTGLNTKASQQGIQDQEMFVCDGFMPLGPNNLRALRGLGSAIYTATGGHTIENYSFNNIGSTAICMVALSDGSIKQINVATLAVTAVAAAGTITTFPVDFNQWAGLYVIIVSPQTNGYWLWDGHSLFGAGTISPEVLITNSGSAYTSQPTITTGSGTQATGSIAFASNPTPGDTITLNGVVLTFVASGPTGNQILILGTVGGTIGISLIDFLTATTNAALTVANYSWSTPSTTNLNITYGTAGIAGNSYTLAASAATPSGGTLTGGAGDPGIGTSFSAVIANGMVTSVHVDNPGHGFVLGNVPILTFSGGGSDTQAKATVSISTAGGILSVDVTNGGHGYSSLTFISYSGTGTNATFSVVGSNGVITGISILNPGSGFTATPSISITDPATSGGSGATALASIGLRQLGSISITNAGTNYTSPPAITVYGDGINAQVLAEMSGSTVANITIVNAGTGYTFAALGFTGGNRAASATVGIMPFGVAGTTVETYQSRVWVGNGRVGQVSGPGSPSDFDAGDGAAAFQSTDSFLRRTYTKFMQSNGFLYLFADSSLNYISGVTTSGVPAATTFNNQNVDPQTGTPWPGTVQPFGRDLVFANAVGVYVSYGGAVTKVSDALDGIYTTVPQTSWPAGFEPSAAVMNIFGIRVYILAMPILDQITNQQVIKCLMWDGKRWWTSPQQNLTLPVFVSQDFNSQLTAYCSADGTTIKPMFDTYAESFSRYLESKLWNNPGLFMTKQQSQLFASLNINYVDLSGSQATGSIAFSANANPGDTVTLTALLVTLVSGTAVGNQVQITGTGFGTTTALAAFLNASSDPLLSVATYLALGPGPAASSLSVTYDAAGSIGNNYTLAASAGTPSGTNLSGGSDGPVIYYAPINESGVGTEMSVNISNTGPVVFGPLPSPIFGKLIGIRFRTGMSDIQINELTIINQSRGSNV